MFELKCAICGKILGESELELIEVCGDHSQEEIRNFLNPLTWDDIRQQRNILLADSDWTQLLDTPLTVDKRSAWATYRQALRDLPASFESPADVVFPVMPE